MTERPVHHRLANGIELAVLPVAGRRVAAMEIRVLGGYAYEDSAYLGVAHVLQETITKGTARRDGRALNDAFDEIGASHRAATGRETIGFSSLCLPEFIGPVLDLHAEIVCTPTFPEDACRVAVDLTDQARRALDDDPQELAAKLLQRQAYEGPLGRHELGEAETLARVGRAEVVRHWKRRFTPRRMHVVLTGAVEPAAVIEKVQQAFAAYGGAWSTPAASGDVNKASDDQPTFTFRAGRAHHPKDVQQEQIAVCFPGAAATDDDLPAERVLLGVLSGGMSSRLWSAVREKEGLVYWVGAWADRPRAGGAVHLGASTIADPAEAARTYGSLLREVDRVAEDLTEAEVERAITGILARADTHDDTTRAKAMRMTHDLFYYGRLIPIGEVLARVKAVTVDDIRAYLERHPRTMQSVVTLGPVELAAGS